MSVRKPKATAAERKIIFERNPGVYGALGYRSASVADGEARSYVSYPGFAHAERDRTSLINQSREFLRNNAIYKGIIEMMVRYIVGNGFELQLSGASKTQCAKAEAMWKQWNRRPEIRNIQSGAKLAQMVQREIFVAGDTALLMTDTGLAQHFEAEQIASRRKTERNKSEFVNGIRKDKYGRPVEFNLCPWKDSAVNVNGGKPQKAENVLYLTDPERPSQVRGVPVMQAAFPMLHRINDICDSEAIAWQLLSRIAVAIERENGPQLGHAESVADPSKSSDELEGDLATRMTELGYALMFHARPGEKVQGIERNIPGKDFTASIRMFLRLLGLPVGCPLELVLLDWTGCNYSVSRAVLQQAFEMFVGWQQMLEDFYYRPLFVWKLKEWQEKSELAKSSKFKIEWIKKTFPWIDALKEAQAYATQVERGFTTHRRVCKSLNTDQDEVIARRRDEVTAAIKLAKEIETDTGVLPPWEYFAGIKPGLDKKDTAKPAEKEEQGDKDE